MRQPLFPQLSQAARILPLVREHISQAAAHCSLPLGFSLDMVPILEEELLGYELVPAGLAETCLTLGCKPDGEPVLRKESLANAPPGALQLATMAGRSRARPAHYPRVPVGGTCDFRIGHPPRNLPAPSWNISPRAHPAVRRCSTLSRTPRLNERSSRPHRGSRSGAPSFISAACQRKSSLDMRCMAPMADAENSFFAIRLSGHCIGNRAAKLSAKHGQR
jgi:hypothetical protein